MEYCSGKELFFHIQKSQRLQESEAVNYFIQLINAIEYIHKQGITHRDLKPENILLSNSILKVIDFGLSNTYRQGEMLSTACGSPSYAPPEMILGRRYHGIYTDLWSCGIILFAMVCGHLPFHDSNEKALFTKITNGIFEVPSYITSTCKDLICRILRLNPSERITLDEIKNHGWIRAVSNKLMTSVQGLVEDIVPPVRYLT